MPNGLDLAAFPHSVRDFSLPKIRILIEGDSVLIIKMLMKLSG